eukprot:12428367-Ditylum_brightwellii.AAC.1
MEKELLSIVLCFKEFPELSMCRECKINVLADCFSRLSGMDKLLEGKRSPNRGTLIAFKDLKAPAQVDELYSYIGEYEEQGLLTECRYSYNYEADITEDE